VIQPFVYKTSDGAGLRMGIKVPGKKTNKTTNEKIAEIREWVALGRRMQADDKKDKKELTASEGLSS